MDFLSDIAPIKKLGLDSKQVTWFVLSFYLENMQADGLGASAFALDQALSFQENKCLMFILST